MERSDNQYQEQAQYPPKELKNLSVEDILRWLEQTNRFFRGLLGQRKILRWKEIK